jgi:hypothetical protein
LIAIAQVKKESDKNYGFVFNFFQEKNGFPYRLGRFALKQQDDPGSNPIGFSKVSISF